MSDIIPRDPCQPITAGMWAELERRWPNGERLLWAFRLAHDVETCADLITGRPVDEARLDPETMFAARRQSLVQLSAPIDLLNIEKDVA
jgi:hypothetical protein